jgi:hypothetical protein
MIWQQQMPRLRLCHCVMSCLIDKVCLPDLSQGGTTTTVHSTDRCMRRGSTVEASARWPCRCMLSDSSLCLTGFGGSPPPRLVSNRKIYGQQGFGRNVNVRRLLMMAVKQVLEGVLPLLRDIIKVDGRI